VQNSILQWLSSKMLERPLQPRELLTARKLVYVALIIVLFTASFFWRRAAVDARAEQLAIRQDSRGDVELSGELVRLSLTGSRGLAVCFLWNQAIEKQKKNQWNELEFLVRSVTKLQPHFITPWLFQSWNLAYNVSVESDRVNDKYFYITRGVDLLAEGERQNRYHPDMRFSIGFYTQHKIMVSDQTNVLRSLFQLSLIPPSERDPDRFIKQRDDGGKKIDLEEFEKFVTKYPQLARRLHSGMLRDSKSENQNQFTCHDADEVVRWLRDNWRVPGIYVLPEKKPGLVVDQKDVLLPPESRFPPLPPPKSDLRPTPFSPAPDFKELTWDSNLDDTIDGFCVARAWYGYAQEPIPAPGMLPGSNKEVEDRVKQRRPKHMTTLLFRNYPSLAQGAAADRLEQEGWFRPDEAEERRAAAEKRAAVEYWEFPEDSWFKRNRNRFADGKPARLVLEDDQHADKQWAIAHSMWRQHGEANHLFFSSPQKEAETYQDALQYAKAKGYALGTQKPVPEEGEKLTGEQRKQFDAACFMFEYKFYRDLSNFPHHFYRSNVEQHRITVLARKQFYAAETLYQLGEAVEARRILERPGAIATWRDMVLLGMKRPDERGDLQSMGLDPIVHRVYREDLLIQEYTYETQLRYNLFFNEQYSSRLKQHVAYQQFLMGRLGQHLMTAAGAPLPPDLRCWLFPIRPLVFDEDYAGKYAQIGHVVGSPCAPAGPLHVAGQLLAVRPDEYKSFFLRNGVYDEHLFDAGAFGLAASPLAPGPLLTLATVRAWSPSLRSMAVRDQPILSFPQIYHYHLLAFLNGPFDVLVFDVDEKEQPQLATALFGSAFEPMATPVPMQALFVLGSQAKPLITEHTKQIVRERKGLNPRKPPPSQPAPEGEKKAP
jgi:hypothetical protein